MFGTERSELKNANFTTGRERVRAVRAEGPDLNSRLGQVFEHRIWISILLLDVVGLYVFFIAKSKCRVPITAERDYVKEKCQRARWMM